MLLVTWFTQLQTTSFRKDHDIVVVSLDNLAYAKAKTGDTEKALQVSVLCAVLINGYYIVAPLSILQTRFFVLKICKGVLRTQETKFGCQSREAVETIGLMGLLYCQNEDYRDALKCLSTVLKWQQKHLKAHNPAIRNTKDTIKKIERSVQGEASAWI